MAGWRPWAELRQRTYITLEWAWLTGCRGRIEDLGGGRRRITIDAGLDQRTRRAVLTHELVHDERNILFTNLTPSAVVEKEEALVEAETACRLVPLDELDGYVRTMVCDGQSVGWREVAETFDVPRDIAQRSLELLQQRVRSRHPTSR